MTWTWTSAFENYPTGSDKGLVTAAAIRQRKEAFKERVEAQHEFDDSADAIMTHRPGYCTVVEITDSPGSVGLDGGLQYDGTLYRDNGISIDAAAGASHNILANRDENDHTQYLLLSGGTFVGDLSLSSLTGLPTTYTGSEVNGTIISRGQHLSDHASGGADHDDDTVGIGSSLVDSLKLAKLNMSKNEETFNLSGTNFREVRHEKNASWPLLVTGETLFAVYASGDFHDDYFPNYRMKFTQTGTITTVYWLED